MVDNCPVIENVELFLVFKHIEYCFIVYRCEIEQLR